MKKKIAYLIFSPQPSSIVRAKTFKTEYEKNNYNVFFIDLYSTPLLNIANNFKKYNFFYFHFLFIKLNSFFREFKSFFFLLNCNKYDGIIIIKYIKLPFLIKIKKKFNGKTLYDFDDSVWIEQMLGKDEFKAILLNVDFVSCDNEYLLQSAAKFNKNVFILNGPTQIEKFNNFPKKKSNKIVIGWIGGPDTLFYLYSIYDALEFIGEQFDNVVLRLVGVGVNKDLVPNFEKIKLETKSFYNETQMIDEVSGMDIGLFPMYKNQLSYGRGMLKAKIYMSGKVPVICTDLGIGNDVIINEINGFLCKNPAEWIAYLKILIENKDLRIKVGETGYKTILNNFTKENCFENIEKNFLSNL